MNKRRVLAIITAMIMMLSVASSCVFASTPSSDWKTTGTINGHKYKYRSQLDFYNTTKPYKVAARGHAMVTSGSVGAGYIGVRALLYKSNGSLAKGTDWDFNDSKCQGVSIPGDTVSTAGNYYSKCKFKFYKGNNYSIVYTAYKSPQVNVKTSSVGGADVGIFAVKTNSNGETYGSGLSEMVTGNIPDYILADGDNGVQGYVKSTDLDDGPNTIDEALETSVSTNEIKNKKIPLYDKEGNVIGTFTLTTIGAQELDMAAVAMLK